MGMIDRPSLETRLWLPLSLAQRGVWLDAMMLADPSAYQLCTLARIEGELDPGLARQAVRVMMGRHDALRLRVDPSEPRQWVEARAEPPFRLIDLSRDADPERRLEAHVQEARADGFTLGDQPLFRLDLVKLGPADWRLLMICHHLVADGIAVGLVQRHWLQAYNALLGEDEEGDTGSPAPDPAPPSSYLPVIEDDAAYAASRRYAEDLAYWQARMSPLPSLLFEDRPRPSHAGDGTAPAGLTLDAATFLRFEGAARAARATPHRALMGLIGLMLFKRYRVADFAIGMALHRRDHASAHVIGMLAGMIAVRCRIDPMAGVAEAVGRIAAEIDGDLRHQRTPIDELGRSLGLGALGRKALFDVAVTIMPPFKEAVPTLGGAPVTSRSLRGPEGSPLTLSARELPERGGLTIDFGFDPAVLSAREVGRLRDLLAELVDAFLEDPTRRVAEGDGLTSAERGVIEGWSAGKPIPVPPGTVADLFAAQVARTPDASAIVADAGSLTYAELDAAADRLAARILAQDRGPQPVIGVAAPRSILSAVALLGILKAGATYLPLDPAYPPARLEAMIADAAASLVLTTADGATILPGHVPTLRLDADATDGSDGPVGVERRCTTQDRDISGPNRPQDIGVNDSNKNDVVQKPVPAFRHHDREDTAYIIFTSGSTGRPKGVAMAHRALVNLAAARQIHDPIGPGDRVLAAISIGFDVSIGQLLLPLLSGATVVVAGDIRGLSPDAFWDFMIRHRVSHVNSVPSFFESVIGGAPAGTRLTRLMLGGEPLSGDLAARIRARLDGTEVVNMYGPTEACIDASAFPVPASGLEREAVLPIGRPLPNYAIHLLDPALRPVPIGAVGELFIGGAGLAEGYVGAPDLTAERFIETTERGRLYRTGDRAAWREDGTIAFLGRVDAQVKIRGFRVEPAEIEAAIETLPGVAQAAVIARPDGRGGLRLLAYWVAEATAANDATAALPAQLGARLPAHMVPAAWTRLDALPLTPNGKLDERALPEPIVAAEAEGTAPRNATERLLAGLFADLLGVPSVHIETSFFDLGGHSLLATQLAARLRERLGIELPIRTLFEAPRIVDLAPRIDMAYAQARGTGSRSILPLAPRAAPLPLSFAQERLWFLHRLDPQSAAYNIPIVLRLDGPLDVDALRSALDALVARHESLRTRFVESGGAAVQIVLDPYRADVSIEDRDGEGFEEAVARAAAAAARPFDLERDAPLRARVLRLGDDAHVLVIVMHHIVSDGWSTGVLVRDVAALYEAGRAGTAAELPRLPLHYADYALWQRQWLAGPEFDRQCDYWRAALADAPEALTLATDRPRPRRPSFAGASQPVLLSPQVSAALAALARAEQATPFMVLIACWAALLSRCAGQDVVVIGAPIANRTQAETENLIGFFVNTLPLRADLAGNPTFRQLVGRLRGRVLDAFAHQDLPFEKLVDVLNPRRDLGRHPIFQVMFVLDSGSPDLALRDVKLTPVRLPEVHAKFDLTLSLAETPEGFSGAISYATDLFAPETMARLSERFERLVEAVIEDPDRSLDSIDLVGPAERRQLLTAWAGTIRAARLDTIPALFEAQAAATPDAAAVIFDGRVLTYAGLDAAASRLARVLMERGIGPEQPVGVALERSEVLVVAALAVMKAGGVYLPLDPAYPPARLADLISDAGAALVLTTRSLVSRLPAEPPRIALDALGLDLAPGQAFSPSVRNADLEPHHLAYMVFTSGSTGRPKGVAVSHAALANLAAARRAHDPIGPGDRVLAALSIGFDVSIGQIVTPLLSGATVVVTRELSRMTGADFWTLLRDQTVTHVNAGPAFLEAVIGSAPPGLALARLMLGGEPFRLALAQRLRLALPATEIFNMYGPSETCIDATFHRFTGEETAPVLPIGRPLPNYVLRILGREMRPTGIGMAGEIYIGGDSLARGYVGRPEMTRDRFVPDPFGPAGARLYRTGDLGVWLADGSVEFIGRADSQVKIRGFRVELGEVEAAIRTHPSVRAAAVVTRTPRGEAIIAAFIVSRGGDEDRPSVAELRRHIAARLPDHMVPRSFAWLDALPLTLNGKIDVKALPDPDLVERDGEEAPPRHDQDRKLLAIWRDVLGRDRIGIDDNFFDLGGHSLMALRIAAACAAQLDVDLPISSLFLHQTVRSLADAMTSGGVGDASGPVVTLRSGGSRRPLFCIHAVGGSAFAYRPLAEALGPEQPVYGLQASGLQGGEPLPASLQDMAASYGTAIRACQPEGPYRLLGHSFGGLVAFEIARQFEVAGDEIELLAMLDTSLPAADRTARPSQLLADHGLRLPEQDGPQARRIEAVVANNLRLMADHVPAALRAALIYIAADRGADEDGRAAFWTRHSARPLAPTSLCCGHYDMLAAPTAALLAPLLAEGLRTATLGEA